MDNDTVSIIKSMISKAHIRPSDRMDLFQDLCLYYLQLEQEYNPDTGIPLRAYILKYLKWKMWALVKSEYGNSSVNIEEDVVDYRNDDTTDLTPLFDGLNKVPQADLELLILRHVSGKTYTELSNILGLSIEGVRKKLFKIEGNIRWEEKNKVNERKEK